MSGKRKAEAEPEAEPALTRTQHEKSTHKKARQTLDLMSGSLRRQRSAQDLFDERKETPGLAEQELTRIFKVFDKDGDGSITEEELVLAYRSMGKRPLKRKIRLVMELCDKDNNGTIELAEFITCMQLLQADRSKEDEPAATAATGEAKVEAKVEPAVTATGEAKVEAKEEATGEEETSTAPRPQIPQRSDSRTIERGENYIFESKFGQVQVGLGWGSAIDLDVGVLMFDKNKAHVDTVDWRNLKSSKYDVHHSGDITDGSRDPTLGDTDQEKVHVNLTSLGDDIAVLIFALARWTNGKTWKDVKSGYVRFVNLANDEEVCRYTLDMNTLGDTRSLVLCKIYKSRDGSWKMMPIGEPLPGDDVKEPRKTLPLLGPYLFEDHVPAGTKVTKLT